MSILGNGNVAIDIARVFLKGYDLMKNTDTHTSVLDNLKRSNLKTVEIIGRRGIIQSAFTTKEIRELTKIPGLELVIVKEELERSMNEESLVEIKPGKALSSRAVKRRTDFLKETCAIISEKDLESTRSDLTKKLIFRYLVEPDSVSVD